MTQEWKLKTLTSLGFKQTDAQVYIFLSKNRRQKAADIVQTLGLTKRQVYRSLKSLSEKGVLRVIGKRPAKFLAVPLDNALEVFKNAREGEASYMEYNKKEILAMWQDLIGNINQ